MNNLDAFAMGEANRGKKMMVFDWDKAARLINLHCIQYAEAGIKSDWEYTGGTIINNGVPISDSYTYLASTWATPQLLDITNNETYDCYMMEDDVPESWGKKYANIKWPESALAILRRKK
jgi:hypothetical protein